MTLRAALGTIRRILTLRIYSAHQIKARDYARRSGPSSIRQLSQIEGGNWFEKSSRQGFWQETIIHTSLRAARLLRCPIVPT